MNVFKRTVIILVFSLLSTSSKAQEWEFGAWLGASGYFGDLNPTDPFKFTDPAGSLNVRYAYSPFNAFKLAFTYGRIRGNDADSKFALHRLRNLSFYSDIYEVALLYEYYFFPYYVGSGKNSFTPYVFTGLSGFKFEPKADLNGTTYKLRELGTEGQGTILNADKQYRNISMAIPFGLGIKYNFAGNFNIGLELGYRNTFTDYLDDVSKNYVDRTLLATASGQISSDLSDRSGEVNGGVYMAEPNSQRGDKSKRDFIMFTGITITYTLTPIKCPPFKELR